MSTSTNHSTSTILLKNVSNPSNQTTSTNSNKDKFISLNTNNITSISTNVGTNGPTLINLNMNTSTNGTNANGGGGGGAGTGRRLSKTIGLSNNNNLTTTSLQSNPLSYNHNSKLDYLPNMIKNTNLNRKHYSEYHNASKLFKMSNVLIKRFLKC
jgi:hypothetical protein